MKNPGNNFIEHVIRTVLSCRTEEQLDVALKYVRLTKKYYLNMFGSENAAGQFRLDMTILVYVKLLELQRDKQNSANN